MSDNKKKIKTEHTGTWFIPNGKFHLEGKLVIDDYDCIIILRLFTDKGFSVNNIKDSFENQPIILGYCKSDSRITLLNCKIKQALPVGANLYEVIYEPSICYYGGIITDCNNLNIYSLTCTFPYFSSWYDTNRHYFGTLSSDTSIGPFEPSIKQEDLIDEIVINDGLSIVVERRYDDFNQLFSKEVHHKVEHFVHFVSKTPKTLEDFKKHANTFLQLIKLSIGQLIYADIRSMVIPKSEVPDFDKRFLDREGNVLVSISTFSSIQKRKVISSDYIHQNHMLFYGGLKENNNLKPLIKKWFNVFDDYNVLYKTYLDTFEWFQKTDAFLTDVMFNNRLANLVQGIEYYYSITESERTNKSRTELKCKLESVIGKLEEEKDKEFLNNHIQYHETLRHKFKYLLFDKFDIVANEIFSNKKDKKLYIHKIKEFRDKLSHGEKTDSPNEKTYDYYSKTLILVLSCILETLGFSKEEIRQRLLGTFKYNSIIQMCKLKIIE